MLTILIGFFTVVLVLICAYVVLIVLMQRASTNAGLGSALGGGAMESALGGGASNVLTRGTVLGAALFFSLAFILYLGHMANYEGDIRPSASLLDADMIAPAVEEEAAPSALQGSLTETNDAAAPADAQPLIQTTITDSADAATKAVTPEVTTESDIKEEAPATEQPAAEAASTTESPTQEEQADASAE
ncbi:preprotein translocase subunit SecG [Rubellicoccus peritrichatus]|uniref:Protein-export membrane protein SecG n=1 Tax=Rubellicoccus peritrichatus TaxID=3080537 RepID=A0AAQ3LDA9_9BACT|nr:preprotein translocase subunit SecG [Puniceicoccus sp. CR14]WOO43376.1 preprotein translocase subunit SecG [Puniceicoccus sp. CR14]